MDNPENIPLDEAVKRGLIPCAKCGAKGAGVERVEGKPHFLCAKCAKGLSSWIAAGVGVLVLLGAVWFMRPAPAPPRQDTWFAEADALLRSRKYKEARSLLDARARETPNDARVFFLLGQCLLAMGNAEGAHAAFTTAAADPEAAPVNLLWAGVALQRMGRSAEALPLLRSTAAGPRFEESRRPVLVECLLDLELYDEALKSLGPERLWERHRALRYGGQQAEADALLAKADPKETWSLKATQFREDGDFDGARAVIAARRKDAPGDRRTDRAELALAVEAGDVPRLHALTATPDAEGLWFRAVAHLLEGKPAEARTAAEAFLAKDNPEQTSFRLERLQMRFLAGKAKVEEVEAEAKATSRVRANDLYWFLAIATGERAWAEKGLAQTPGRNFPYHALKRAASK